MGQRVIYYAQSPTQRWLQRGILYNLRTSLLYILNIYGFHSVDCKDALIPVIFILIIIGYWIPKGMLTAKSKYRHFIHNIRQRKLCFLLRLNLHRVAVRFTLRDQSVLHLQPVFTHHLRHSPLLLGPLLKISTNFIEENRMNGSPWYVRNSGRNYKSDAVLKIAPVLMILPSKQQRKSLVPVHI